LTGEISSVEASAFRFNAAPITMPRPIATAVTSSRLMTVFF